MSSFEMRTILDQLSGLAKSEGRDFTMPDQRAAYDELIDLLEMANEAGMHNAADWLRLQLNKMSVQFK